MATPRRPGPSDEICPQAALLVPQAGPRPLLVGGLWDSWLAPDGITLETCCILTTTPNALLRPIHDRMPVVIPDGQEDTWLLASGADELRYLVPLLLPWQPAGWEAAPVDLP